MEKEHVHDVIFIRDNSHIYDLEYKMKNKKKHTSRKDPTNDKDKYSERRTRCNSMREVPLKKNPRRVKNEKEKR